MKRIGRRVLNAFYIYSFSIISLILIAGCASVSLAGNPTGGNQQSSGEVLTDGTNYVDTTNISGPVVITDVTTNSGFETKFWVTYLSNSGYITNRITNWVQLLTNGVMVSNWYSNSYDSLQPTNYVIRSSNFQVRIGQEMTNEIANTVALWGMNEGSGQTAADNSANGRGLTLGSTGFAEGIDPSWADYKSTGCFSSALYFDSSSGEYAYWNGSYDQGAAVTVAFWMKTTNNTGLVLSGGISNFQVHLDANKIYFTVGDLSTYYAYGISAANITNGKWHYISCTYPNAGGKKIRIFIDGSQNQSGNLGTLTIGTVTNIIVGGQPSSGNYFNGELDNIRIQNVIDGDIATYYTAATN